MPITSFIYLLPALFLSFFLSVFLLTRVKRNWEDIQYPTSTITVLSIFGIMGLTEALLFIYIGVSYEPHQALPIFSHTSFALPPLIIGSYMLAVYALLPACLATLSNKTKTYRYVFLANVMCSILLFILHFTDYVITGYQPAGVGYTLLRAEHYWILIVAAIFMGVSFFATLLYNAFKGDFYQKSRARIMLPGMLFFYLIGFTLIALISRFDQYSPMIIAHFGVPPLLISVYFASKKRVLNLSSSFKLILSGYSKILAGSNIGYDSNADNNYKTANEGWQMLFLSLIDKDTGKYATNREAAKDSNVSESTISKWKKDLLLDSEASNTDTSLEPELKNTQFSRQKWR